MFAHKQDFSHMTTSILLTYYNSIQKLKKQTNTHETHHNFMIFFYNYLKQHFSNITFKYSNAILLSLAKNHCHVKRLLKIMNLINKEIKPLKGGFLYNTYDTPYTKILNIVDVIIAILGLFPLQFVTANLQNIIDPQHLQNIIGPYQLISLFLNLSRGDYMFAFYSFISLIPGIGSIIGSSLKIMHIIIRYIFEKERNKVQHNYLNDIEQMKIINKMVVDYDPTYKYTKYESLNSIENEDLII